MTAFPERLQVGSLLTWRRLPVLLALGVVGFAFAYVLFIATIPGADGSVNWRTTTFGSAVHDPSSFLKIVLNSITFAGRPVHRRERLRADLRADAVVNMAHGSFYLLGGYIAYEVQQGMTGQGFSIASSEVNTWEWLVPLVVAAPCIARGRSARHSRPSCAGTRARSCGRR